MVAKGLVTQGNIENKQMLTDVIVINQAANTSLSKGTFVYEDGTNGAKVVPTDSSIEAKLCRFIENDSNNLTISGIQDGNKGDKAVETYKTGAIVIAKCDGAITVGSLVKPSTTTAGQVEALSTPSDAASPPTDANVNAIRDWDKMKLARYLGHGGEGQGIGNDPTDAADGDLVRLQLL